MSRNYRDLIAWQKGMDLVEEVYRATRLFPADEVYGLTSQIRRAAVSIPANVAEGQGRGGAAEFARFLRIAHGSLREVETHALIAERLLYVRQVWAVAFLERTA
ncbi:MAG: ribosomal protein [Phycisphaerales bacterium]|nr:ribosomal protein [Phycisphaerales bacterium]